MQCAGLALAVQPLFESGLADLEGFRNFGLGEFRFFDGGENAIRANLENRVSYGQYTSFHHIFKWNSL